MNYYRRFLGDYARDTKHLSMLEHGAYTMLLDTLYSTEKPLPTDRSLLFRICSASTKREKKAVESVLSQFFYEEPTGFSNAKFEKEIKHQESRVNAAKDNGKRGGRPRNQEPSANPGHNPGKSSPTPAPYKEKVKSICAITSADFEIFYEAYPRHIGRQGALKAWGKQRLDGHLGEVLASLAAWKKLSQWQEARFIPYPATWLNEERWKESPAEAASGTDRTNSKTAERSARTADVLNRVFPGAETQSGSVVRSFPAGADRVGDGGIFRVPKGFVS